MAAMIRRRPQCIKNDERNKMMFVFSVRLWKLDPNESSTPYPYRCDSVIHTGHTGNIFNAHLLPSSSKMYVLLTLSFSIFILRKLFDDRFLNSATVAADHQVRVFDVERALTTSSQGRETEFSTGQTLQCELRCHTGRTKRIVAEESPDSFLTVGEVRYSHLMLRSVSKY